MLGTVLPFFPPPLPGGSAGLLLGSRGVASCRGNSRLQHSTSPGEDGSGVGRERTGWRAPCSSTSSEQRPGQVVWVWLTWCVPTICLSLLLSCIRLSSVKRRLSLGNGEVLSLAWRGHTACRHKPVGRGSHPWDIDLGYALPWRHSGEPRCQDRSQHPAAAALRTPHCSAAHSPS